MFDLYHNSVLPQAEQALRVAQAGYQAGRTSFSDLLDAWRTVLTFRLEHYQHSADYLIALAQLERACGVNLQEKG